MPPLHMSDIVELIERYPKLDQLQALAVLVVLANRLTIIEAPPGTGKTYVAEVAAREFDLRNRTTPSSQPQSWAAESDYDAILHEIPVLKSPRSQVLIILPLNTTCEHMLGLLQKSQVIDGHSHSFGDALLRLGRPDETPKQLNSYMPGKPTIDISDHHLEEYIRLKQEWKLADLALATAKLEMGEIPTDDAQTAVHNAAVVEKESLSKFLAARRSLQVIVDRLHSAKIVIATPVASHSDLLRSALNVEQLIVDIANFVSLPAFSLPLTHVHEGTRISIIGDRKQLAPSVNMTEEDAERYNFGFSIMEILDKAGLNFLPLSVQYRSNATIAEMLKYVY